MRKAIIGMLACCLAIPIAAPSARAQGHGHGFSQGHGAGQGHGGAEHGLGGRGGGRDWHRFGDYDHDRLEPGFNSYDADRYYRDGRYYGERRMHGHERLYRGGSGRYYCRRSDGTTGLIVGGTLDDQDWDELLGIGDSEVLDTLADGGAGAILGSQIDRGNIRCR